LTVNTVALLGAEDKKRGPRTVYRPYSRSRAYIDDFLWVAQRRVVQLVVRNSHYHGVLHILAFLLGLVIRQEISALLELVISSVVFEHIVSDARRQ
jgi:hypothetical protein